MRRKGSAVGIIKDSNEGKVKICFNSVFLLCLCGGLTLTGHQMPTRAALSLSSVVQWRENTMKGLLVGVRRGDHSAISITGETGLIWGKINLILISYQSNHHGLYQRL